MLGCGDRVPLYAAALIHSALLDGAGFDGASTRLARLARAATMADEIAGDPTVDGLERFRAHAARELLSRACSAETVRRVLGDPIPYALTGAGLAATA